MSVLGELIRARRTSKGISQRELALSCGLKTPQYISNVERGVCSISPALVKSLARRLGFSVKNVVDAVMIDTRKSFLKKI